MDQLLALLSETTPMAWTTIGLTSAVAGAVELGKAWPLIQQKFRDDTLIAKPALAAGEDDDETDGQDNRTLARRARDYIMGVVIGGAVVISADRVASWQVGAALAAMVFVPLIWKWARDRFEKVEMLERQQLEHEPFADTIFDHGRSISIPPEAAAGFAVALVLVGMAITAILLFG